jgi:hypothetical protein
MENVALDMCKGYIECKATHIRRGKYLCKEITRDVDISLLPQQIHARVNNLDICTTLH